FYNIKPHIPNWTFNKCIKMIPL
ncbi:hypothetical protein, partial [Plasmodium yoelii yoelii]